MAASETTLNQSNNIGFVIGNHYGDNVIYPQNAESSPRYIALENHKAKKTDWEDSGTCGWFLEKKSFQSWEALESKSAALLIHGSAGVGKSTLISRVIAKIQHDRVKNSRHDIYLCYFYVGYLEGADDGKPYRDILMTFWDQITDNPVASSDVFGKNPSTKTLEEELQKVFIHKKRDVYIVVDALDQLPNSSNYQLCAWLQSLEETQQGKYLRIAVSSRSKEINKEIKLRQQLNSFEVFEIEVTPQDIRLDIEKHVNRNLKSALFEDQKFKKKVSDKIIQAADGMFLWAHLKTLELNDFSLKTPLDEALETLTLPGGIEKMYVDYFEEFEALKPELQAQIPQRLMALLANNAGSMSIAAILVALSINSDGKLNQEFYRELKMNPSCISRLCKHLVTVNESLGVIQFTHRTMVEFFRNHEKYKYQARIAELCLAQLSSPSVSQGPLSGFQLYNHGCLLPTLQEHPFLFFACSKWASSIKQSFELGPATDFDTGHEKRLDLLNKVCKHRLGTLQLAFQVYWSRLDQTLPTAISPTSIVCYFALAGLIGQFDKSWFEPWIPNENGSYPIHWAARNTTDPKGSTKTIEALLNVGGANLNIIDEVGRTALHHSAISGNKELASFLINRKAKINIKDNRRETALIAACRGHHEPVIDCLLKARADVKVQSQFGTALQAISLTGCERCAKVILKKYGRSKIIEDGGPFGSSLHTAAFWGHFELVQYLCTRKGIKIRKSHRDYGSPVTAAAAGFTPGGRYEPFEKIMNHLIIRGANIHDPNGKLGPALRCAAEQGSVQLVNLLLKNGAEVCKAGILGTAYEAASRRGHEDVVKILLENDPRAAMYNPDTASPDASQLDGRHQMQRNIFKSALKMGNMDTVKHLLTQAENFYVAEARKTSPKLSGLAKLLEVCFQDVIDGTIEDKPQKPRRLRRLWKLCGSLKVKYRKSTVGLESQRDFFSRKVSFPRAVENYPQVLDCMTQTGMTIMEKVNATEKLDVIKSTAHTWVEVLSYLFLHDKDLLETVIQKRAAELKQRLTNDKLTGEEKLSRAKSLACVGVELILRCVESEERFADLSFVLCNIWIKALIEVEEIGKEGTVLVQDIVDVFTQKFFSALEVNDRINVMALGQTGFCLLNAAALTGKKEFLDTLTRIWLGWYSLAWVKMDHVADNLAEWAWKKYQHYLENGEHEEATGFALMGMGSLRVAINDRFEAAASTLQHTVERGFRILRDRYQSDFSERRLKDIFTSFVDLIATAEQQKQPGRLRNVTSSLLEFIEIISEDDYERIQKVINEYMSESSETPNLNEREMRCRNINVAFIHLLGNLSGSGGGRQVRIKEKLEGVAKEALEMVHH